MASTDNTCKMQIFGIVFIFSRAAMAFSALIRCHAFAFGD